MRLTVKAIQDKKKARQKIAVLTAYDYLTARLLDEEGVDIVLVGDSVGMILLGYESTVPVSLREMLHHAKAVARAVNRALVVADMPFGSYATPEKALRNAHRLIKEAGVHAVKLEGGKPVKEQVQALIRAGVPVMGHLGLTPQTASQLGGYRVRGRTREEAEEIFKDALLLDKLGVFSLVLECVPEILAAKITRSVGCPTIGIGAGVKTDGQVLVLHDMLGFESRVNPKFVRRYANLGRETREAIRRYCQDVAEGKFPAKGESY